MEELELTPEDIIVTGDTIIKAKQDVEKLMNGNVTGRIMR